MDRRSSRTSLPNTSNNDSGVGNSSFASQSSQIAPEEGAQRGVQQGIEDPAPRREVEANAALIVPVQESGDAEGDIDLHPPSRIVFRSDGENITLLHYVDIDILVARALEEEFRQLLVAYKQCRTCFTRRRDVINLPCMCICNCQQCGQVMNICSLCYSRIDLTAPVVFQYTG